MLYKNYIHHKKIFEHTEISPRQVVDMCVSWSKVDSDIKLHQSEFKYLKNEYRKRFDVVRSLGKASRIFEKRLQLLRKYEYTVAGRNYLKRDSAYITIEITRHKRGRDCQAEIELAGWGCSKRQFDDFAQFFADRFNISEILPESDPLDIQGIEQRWLPKFVDPELVKQCSGAMEARQFDTALKAALVVVESRLRKKCINSGCKEASESAGADLAVLAFHSSKGCLVPPWPIATQASHGCQLLFQGFFLYFRNAIAHHSEVIGSDRTAVLELMVTCELMLKIIDNSTVRGG